MATTVVSSVDAAWPPDTTLPTLTNFSEMRPPIGARTCVNSTFSAAVRSAARATIRAASASFRACVLWSNSSWLMPRMANSASPRVKSVGVSTTRVCARTTSARSPSNLAL